MHFFDGFRTSHEIQKVEVMDYEVFENLLDKDAVKRFRERALTFEHPVTRGSAQNDDVYFQTREIQNKFYNEVPSVVADYMKKISEVTGRTYAPLYIMVQRMQLMLLLQWVQLQKQLNK